MAEIDKSIYYLQHHNKNLTKAQEREIDALAEYREGRFGFSDMISTVKNGGLENLISYLEYHGEKIYSKEALITLINAIYGALMELELFPNQQDRFNQFLLTQMEMLKVDFDGKEGR